MNQEDNIPFISKDRNILIIGEPTDWRKYMENIN